MGFFKDLKEDLSQAVNELIPEDELLGQEEYVDNLDEDLIGLDDMKNDNLSSASLNENNEIAENDLKLQLEDDSFVNTLDNELASSLDNSDISEPVLTDKEEVPSFEMDDNQADDLSDLVKEFENQIMKDESNLSFNDEIDTNIGLKDSDKEDIELNLMDYDDFSMEEELPPLEDNISEEEPLLMDDFLENDSLPLDLEENLLEEENLPIEDSQSKENLSLENIPLEEQFMEEPSIEDVQTEEDQLKEIEPSTLEDVGLMEAIENESQEIEQLPEMILDGNIIQENMEANIDNISDTLNDTITMNDDGMNENESQDSSEGEGELEQQMEEETMSGLDEVLGQTDNLENESVDMDLIAQMLEEEEETPLVIPDEMPNMEEPIMEEEVTPSEVFAAETEQIEKKIEAATTEVDSDVTIITKGTRIEGNIISDCSLEVMGTIKGDIECLGKLSVTGHVEGNSSAAEIFVNTTRLQGNLESKGAVKLGAGTVVLGDIVATSAVIAGAVKGEIDVDGPIIVDSTAIVKGNIKAKSVQVNNGAVIDGYCSLAYAALDIDNFFDGENAE